MFRIGIVGHRYLANRATIEFVEEQCTLFLKDAYSEHQDLAALSAIAEGADTLDPGGHAGAGTRRDPR